jgi:putative transcriptional regulator
MTMTKHKSVINVVHETAGGLHRAGLMDTKTTREFDVLCLPRVKAYTAVQIKRIRISTVQKWERGEKRPNGPSLKLLNLVAGKGLQALT